MVRSLLVAGFLAVSLFASPSLAWHEVGHMLTVLVAYKQLSPGDKPSEAVKKLVAILKHHPRYREDFANSMPSGLSEDGEARWLLCRASVWPDQIRIDRENEPSYPPEPARQGSYHRGIWHYIDAPLVIVAEGTSPERVKALEEKARAGQDLSTDVSTDEKKVRNVLQAIAFNRERFVHGKPEEKAVALCWLLHTLGDIHQPLHGLGRRTRLQPRCQFRSRRVVRPALQSGLCPGIEADRPAAGRRRSQRARQTGCSGKRPRAMDA
ncbi:MAG: S1/P1 nuclease [Thermoguttaceae bacterium]